MKKVKTILSAAYKKVSARKWVAVISAIAIVVTSVTFIFSPSFNRKALAQSSIDEVGSQEILKLSESYLSNADKNISMLELSGKFSNFNEDESESVKLIEELSTGSESERNADLEVQTEKETQAKAPETTTKTEITTVETKPVSADGTNKGGYTFSELGLTQISDIEIPDDILFDENGVPLNYSRKLTGKSTAYCMGHTTATGTSVHEGVVAVNPNIIPYGSKMYIVGTDGTVYGYSSAEDTGGFIYWNNAPLVDLYVNTESVAYQWGNRQVTIYIF